MQYRTLGRTGFLVFLLCLGALNFGGPTAEADAKEVRSWSPRKSITRKARLF